jgi:hypothetical protein
VHGRLKIRRVQYETLQQVPPEWTAIYEPNCVDRYLGSATETEGMQVPLQVLKSLSKRRWIETDRQGIQLYARRTKLGSDVAPSAPPERVCRRPDVRGINVL